MNAIVEHLTKAEQGLGFVVSDLAAVLDQTEVSMPNQVLMSALISQAKSLQTLVGMVREGAQDEAEASGSGGA